MSIDLHENAKFYYYTSAGLTASYFGELSELSTALDAIPNETQITIWKELPERKLVMVAKRETGHWIFADEGILPPLTLLERFNLSTEE